MSHKLQTREGLDRYARRKAIVEPVNGQIKEAGGFRRFHLRGDEKVRKEWALVCTGHNLKKLFGAMQGAMQSGPPARAMEAFSEGRGTENRSSPRVRVVQ